MTIPASSIQSIQPNASTTRAISTTALWLVAAIALLAVFAGANVALDVLPTGTVAEFLHDGRHILGIPGH